MSPYHKERFLWDKRLHSGDAAGLVVSRRREGLMEEGIEMTVISDTPGQELAEIRRTCPHNFQVILSKTGLEPLVGRDENGNIVPNNIIRFNNQGATMIHAPSGRRVEVVFSEPSLRRIRKAR